MKGKISYISALLAILLNVSVMNAAPPDILKEYWEKHFNDPSVSIAKRLDYADSLIKYSDSKERGSLLNKKGNAAYSIGNYPRAMEAYRQLYYDGFPELSPAERLATIERMARCENYMGNYDKAVRFAKELFEADKPDSLNYLNATSYIDICQVYKSFFDNLHSVAPNLTQGEIRMSAFVSMNLTAKEIASLTNRSVRTVETLKYRLAKKLLIPADTLLYEYLRSLQ